MRRNVLLTIALLLLVLNISGCWSRRELNDLAITLAVGIDKLDDDYLVTAQVVNPEVIAAKKGGSPAVPTVLYTSKGATINEAFRRMTTVSPRRIYVAHLRLLIAGETVAKEGLRNVLDVFSRGHEFRKDFYIMVARHSAAKDVLSILPRMGRVNANKLFDSLEISEKIWAPTRGVTLDDLVNNITTDGIEPVLPSVEIINKSGEGANLQNWTTTVDTTEVQLTSFAVLKKDKLLGYLEEKSSKGYNYISNYVKSTAGVVSCPKGGRIGLENLSSECKINASLQQGKPVFDVHLDVVFDISEVTCDIDLTQLESITAIARRQETELRQILKRTLQQSQAEYNSDILGLGHKLRLQCPDVWEQMKDRWDQEFPHMPVRLHIKAKIRGNGTINESISKKL